MLTVVRDDTGRIRLACDWWLTDAQGYWNPTGSYIWVNQVEGDLMGTTRQEWSRLVREIGKAAPSAVGASWERHDKSFSLLRGYRRNQLVKEVRV